MKRHRFFLLNTSLKFRLIAATTGLLILAGSLFGSITAFYSARTLKVALNRQLSSDVRQGAETIHRFFRETDTRLELWSVQPVIHVFLDNPAMASISRSGVAAFFRKAREKDPWISDILLAKDGRIQYRDSGAITIDTQIPSSGFSLMERPHGGPPLFAFSRHFPDQTELMITVVMDLEKIKEHFFGYPAAESELFVTLGLVQPEQRLRVFRAGSDIREAPDPLKTGGEWGSVSEIYAEYPSVPMHHAAVAGTSVIVFGAVSPDRIHEPVQKMILVSIITGILVSAIGILFISLLASSITAPLAQLTGEAESFLSSESPEILENRENRFRDEIRILRSAFTVMLQRIKNYTDSLETDLVTRNRELEHANQRMETEINERRKMEQNLREAREAAEKANRVKSMFLANMSHEIRTPMNSVLGFLELTLDENLSPGQRKNLETAHRSARSLLTLINDILDVSKLESGRLELDNRPFDLRKLIENTLQSFEIQCREKGLKLVWEVHPNLSTGFIGDPDRLRQILVNLVGNAVKFTEAGRITVTVEPTDIPDHVRFRVQDTGIGIPEDRLAGIFDPFTQADTSTTRRFGGTGLGTTVSRQLVQLMDGDIGVTSSVGKGSTFFFSIRLEPTEALPEVEERNAVSASLRCFRILIAEDIEENIVLARIRMEKSGHTVIEARNGREAVEAFRKEAPDLILMDVHMPEMDGLEAARKIRVLEKETGNRVPLIALTASVMKEDHQICIKAGMDEVCGKPVDFDQLAEIMEQRVPEGIGKTRDDVKPVKPEVHDEMPFIEGIDMEKGLRTWQDAAVYQKALLGFSRDYESAAKIIRESLEDGNRENAGRIIHALKGVSGNLAITDVHGISESLETHIRGDHNDGTGPLVASLEKALRTAVASIRQLESITESRAETEIAVNGKASVDMPVNLPVLEELFKGLLVSFGEYNPTAAEPFLKKMGRFLSPDQLGPVRQRVDSFDFDGAREEAGKLADALGIRI